MIMISAYQPLLDFFLLSVGFAYSQQVVLRAGVFSIATAAFAALGGYCSAIMVQRYGVPAPLAVFCGMLLGAVVGYALALSLARLRGVFQAIATLALIQVVVSLSLYFESFTGGAMGLNNIPRVVGTRELLLSVIVVVYLMYALGRSGVGRAFDTIRQDEMVATTLGISVPRYHSIAFLISGALGGYFGALQSLHIYTIDPDTFGFHFATAVLAYIILGGKSTVMGPIVGTAIMVILPEIARPLAEYKHMLQGFIMVVMILAVPHGIVDGLQLLLRQRYAARRDHSVAASGGEIVPSA